MKKIIVFLFTILFTVIIVGCGEKNAKNNINIRTEKLAAFSDDEINSAVDCVKSNFTFPACTLTKVYYDEEKSKAAIESYLTDREGSVNPENIIVLLSEFYVDDSGDNPVLNADTTYSDYNWILIRENKRSNWKINDFGY